MADHPTSTHQEGRTPPKPAKWRRIHHSPFFWVAIVFLFLAMGIFVLTDGFLLRPRPRLAAPAPAAGGP
jgi:hypothetical protein